MPLILNYRYYTVGCKKNGNCENKIDTFLQFFHSVEPSYERCNDCNDIFKNYLRGIVLYCIKIIFMSRFFRNQLYRHQQ
jgi:hypothetical protein